MTQHAMPMTVQTLSLRNGEQVPMTLNMYALYQLKQQKKGLYTRINHILMKGAEDVIDNATVLYCGYLCANLETLEQCMSEEAFLRQLPESLMAVIRAASQLLGVQNPPGSAPATRAAGGGEGAVPWCWRRWRTGTRCSCWPTTFRRRRSGLLTWPSYLRWRPTGRLFRSTRRI